MDQVQWTDSGSKVRHKEGAKRVLLWHGGCSGYAESDEVERVAHADLWITDVSASLVCSGDAQK